jgi:ankyrin repeat protein
MQYASSLSDGDLHTFKSELDLWGNSIKEEVALLMAKRMEDEARDNERFRSVFTGIASSMSRERKLERKLRLLDLCSVYDHETTWKQTRKAGNTSLFASNPEYQAWRGQENTSTLVYTGKLGAGKSVLMSNIVDDINLYTQGKDATVAFFFCRHDITESLKSRTVIGSIAQQLLRRIPEDTLGTIAFDENAHTVDSIAIRKLLQDTSPSDCRAYVILDGIDALDSTEKEDLLEHLNILQGKIKLNLCISHVPGPDAALLSENLDNLKFTSMPENNPEIERFIDNELERCIQAGKLVLGDPSLVLDIRDALVLGNQGMFLWVYLQIQSICSMNTDQDIRQAVACLPKELAETYSRLLKIHEGNCKDHLQTRILKLITAACRPLTTEELREALCVVPGITTWDPQRLPNDIIATLACCGPLVTIDEEDLTVRLVHLSFKQFLLRGTEIMPAPFEAGDIETEFFATLATYLSYNVFETQVSASVVPKAVTQSAPSDILRSTTGLPKGVRDLTVKLLRSRRTPNYDIGSILLEARKLAKLKETCQFFFYSYAKSYWLHHILACSVIPPYSYRLLLKIVQALGEGKINLDLHTETGQSVLCLAAGKGATDLVSLLLESGMVDSQLNEGDTYKQTPLVWAAGNGHNGIVTALLKHVPANKQSKIDPNAQDARGRTALWWASSNGHSDVVKSLLDSKVVDTSLPNDSGNTPLAYACLSGDTTIARALLDSGANPNTRDERGMTPIIHTIERSYVGIVRLLLEYEHFKPDFADSQGRTPLSYAAAGGKKAILKLLLESGKVDPDHMDSRGWTPLALAELSGHAAVVELLLQYGVLIDRQDDRGRTALSLAAGMGDAAIVKALMEYTAKPDMVISESLRATRILDPNLADAGGRTPLVWAAMGNHTVVVELLLKSGVVKDKRDKGGRTAMSLAAERGHVDVVKLLLDHSFDPGVADDAGHTPLWYAQGCGDNYLTIIKLLEDRGETLDVAE